jgi:hypothetical protein
VGSKVKIRAIVLLGTVAVVCLMLLTLQMRGYTALLPTPLRWSPRQSGALARVNRSAVGVWSTYRDWKNVRARTAGCVKRRSCGVEALR